MNWLSQNPTGDTAVNRETILVGDFNAYFGEDPIQWFKTNGYTNLMDTRIGAEHAYSYNFSSQSGYIDHAIANATMTPLITGIAEWHINADEPAVLEALSSSTKNPAAVPAFYAPDEFAASDHDPFLVGFNPLAGDLNDDGVVDTNDQKLIVGAVGQTGQRGRSAPGLRRRWQDHTERLPDLDHHLPRVLAVGNDTRVFKGKMMRSTTMKKLILSAALLFATCALQAGAATITLSLASPVTVGGTFDVIVEATDVFALRSGGRPAGFRVPGHRRRPFDTALWERERGGRCLTTSRPTSCRTACLPW